MHPITPGHYPADLPNQTIRLLALRLRHGVSARATWDRPGREERPLCPALPRARMRAWDGPVAASESCPSEVRISARPPTRWLAAPAAGFHTHTHTHTPQPCKTEACRLRQQLAPRQEDEFLSPQKDHPHFPWEPGQAEPICCAPPSCTAPQWTRHLVELPTTVLVARPCGAAICNLTNRVPGHSMADWFRADCWLLGSALHSS